MLLPLWEKLHLTQISREHTIFQMVKIFWIMDFICVADGTIFSKQTIFGIVHSWSYPTWLAEISKKEYFRPHR